MLASLEPRSVLDVPVGTGRYLPLYGKIGVEQVTGVDSSEEMLMQARRKLRSAPTSTKVMLGDAEKLDLAKHEVVVCVRFLDLIDEEAMRAVMRQITSAATRAVVLTIRLGPSYVCKTNTATHDEKRWRRLVAQLGWRVAEENLVFRQGWRVARLERSSR